MLTDSGAARAIENPQASARQQSQESAAAAVEVSRFRKENGMGPVVSDAQLVAAARAQADAMARAGVMSHEIGGSFSSRIRKAGIQAGAASENVAMGQTSLRETMDSWKASSGHRSQHADPFRDPDRTGAREGRGRPPLLGADSRKPGAEARPAPAGRGSGAVSMGARPAMGGAVRALKSGWPPQRVDQRS